ncbi:MAG: cytidine deaminase [Ignavibacteria bacterium]|nr:cytidine deaminase [Ignavibacteria bacterium]
MHPEYLALIEHSLEARKRSYSPYSRFKVGASLLAGSGKIYTGANIESASYSLTLCAERVAFAKAISDGEKLFKAIAVSVSTKELVYPCGACRQFMFEFAKDLDIIVVKSSNQYVITKLRDLLPEAFERKSITSSKK